MSATKFTFSVGCDPDRPGCRRSPRGLRALLPGLFVLLFAQLALAQSSAMVTEADIARAQLSQPVITERDMADVRRKHRAPSDAELRNAPQRSTPNIGALPIPKVITVPDIEAISRGFSASNQRLTQMQGFGSGPSLLVFISFTIPQATLERLVDQAARAKATLVLRGFVSGSLRDTVLRVQRLIGKRNVAFQIDPQAFDRFQIDKTPSFVLVRDGAAVKPCTAGQCLANDAFVSVAGDVSLDYALEHIARSSPGYAKSAAGFLIKLRSAP